MGPSNKKRVWDSVVTRVCGAGMFQLWKKSTIGMAGIPREVAIDSQTEDLCFFK